MPYDSISDLPKSQVDQYDRHQKEAFLKAFNNAYHEYHGDESQAFAVAHHAAKEAGADEGRSSGRGHSSSGESSRSRQRSGRSGASRSGGRSPGGNGKININQASADELTHLDGVGESTARRIVEYRDKHGRFSDVDELDDVPGIGEATLRRVRGRLST